MKLPRDLSGAKLIKALEKMGYKELRQTGSHVRLVCVTDTEHHLTIPLHDPLKVGTLSAILADAADQHCITREQLIDRIF